MGRGYTFDKDRVEISFFDSGMDNIYSIIISSAGNILVRWRDISGKEKEISITDSEGFSILRNCFNNH